MCSLNTFVVSFLNRLRGFLFAFFGAPLARTTDAKKGGKFALVIYAKTHNRVSRENKDLTIFEAKKRCLFFS